MRGDNLNVSRAQTFHFLSPSSKFQKNNLSSMKEGDDTSKSWPQHHNKDVEIIVYLSPVTFGVHKNYWES